MGCLILVFLVMALVFAGVGFVVHFLWILAAVFFVFWLAGFAFAREGGEVRGVASDPGATGLRIARPSALLRSPIGAVPPLYPRPP